MNRLKQILALSFVCCAAAFVFSDELAFAEADETSDTSSYYEELPEDTQSSLPEVTEELLEQPEEYPETEEPTDIPSEETPEEPAVEEPTVEEPTEETTVPEIDTSGYTDKLNELAQKQADIERKLSEGEDAIGDESERQMLILDKINTLNEKAQVINSYMTELETSISTERQQADSLKREIDAGIADYKKRLRAMYIAGDMSYTDVLLSSGDFFDVLMRSELVKRVADHDARSLDTLVEKKEQYDQKTAKLKSEMSEYEDNSKQLEEERAELAELYNSSSELKKLYKEQQQQLAEQQMIYENEIYSYEGILDDLLKGTYGNNDDEAVRIETEARAAEALSALHESLNERIAAGEVIPPSECSYTFKWPVAGHYYVSSGVGARWGSYHKGLDIPGESGTPILAAEAGEVVRTNNSCVHNYGKTASCGCGGGYGNFVIIDHGNGFLTLYGHMSSTGVEVGDKVQEGDIIGLMGSTGFSTGTHVHFELRYDGYVTNPASFVSF